MYIELLLSQQFNIILHHWLGLLWFSLFHCQVSGNLENNTFKVVSRHYFYLIIFWKKKKY